MKFDHFHIDKAALRKAFTNAGVRSSFGVAIVVGTLLNIVNQGKDLFRGDEIDLLAAGLTYAVPFLVASYGAYNAHRQKS